MRVANNMSWLTKEKTLLQYRLHLPGMTQAGQMSNDGRRSSPCCPIPTASTGTREKAAPLYYDSLLGSLLGPPATVMFQSSPEHVLVGEKERIEEKQTSFAHTEAHT